ncbi:hypothetical protein [Egbenema bharatensis]|uniref:hypothetical protein n=1 Tax=Egbenema bharatensis TaxID=3463334 RepID=UPI003A8ADD00
MHRFSLITKFPLVAATVFAMTIGGCALPSGLFGGGETGEETPTESPVAVSPTDEAAEPAEQPTEEPVADAEAPVTDTVTEASLPRDLDLIPSTDPDQRLQSLDGERNDPFSLVPTTPSVQITITETPQPEAPTAQTPPGTTGNGTTAQTPTPPGTTGNGTGRTPTTTTPTTPGGLAPIPNLVPQPSPAVAAAPLPPPPPQPVLARAVEVLGVVQIGSTSYAIVNAPNEASSRYVRVGQRLSNGQVVVKRIEMNGPEPAVVFEQFGIEVITSVGEGGVPDPSPAATLPTSARPNQPG